MTDHIETQAFDANVSKQRIDFQELPDGTVRALLTVTLPGGMQLTFASDASDHEASAVAGFYDSMEVGMFGRRGEVGATSADKLSPEQGQRRIGFSWRSFAQDPARAPKGWKRDASPKVMEAWWQSIGKEKRGAYKIRYAAIMDHAPAELSEDEKQKWWGTLGKKRRGELRDTYDGSNIFEDLGGAIKSVATSKVFKAAAKGLALVAPALGPFAPAAIAVSAGMGTASSLLSARTAAAAGNAGVAEMLTKQAVSFAKTVAPKNAGKLLAIAQDKSRKAHVLAATAKPVKKAPSHKTAAPRTQARAAPTRAPVTRSLASSSAVLPGSRVTPDMLVKAAQSGNVFVLRAG